MTLLISNAHRERFASEMEEELGIPVRAVDRPELLPDECDLIAACTDSSVPVVLPSFVRPGMYLSKHFPLPSQGRRLGEGSP